ncbi:MAG: MAPEG family protein [Gammaproteobacteria bacterium]
MPSTYIFLPLLLQVRLTVAVYLALSAAKSPAVEQGFVDPARRALHDDAWPESVQKINNNIRNQFEVPVLFYVLVVTLYLLEAAGPVAQALALEFFDMPVERCSRRVVEIHHDATIALQPLPSGTQVCWGMRIENRLPRLICGVLGKAIITKRMRLPQGLESMSEMMMLAGLGLEVS